MCKLLQQQLALLSSNLEGLKGKIPSDFARETRSLDELKRWKATEFHQFLLYTGPAFMKDILSQKSFEHFLALSISIRIMIAYSQNEELLDYSKELLLWFVKNAGHFYGSIFKVYNVRNLIHLHDDIIHHKVLLFDTSAFAFENFVHTLKSHKRKSKELIVHIVNQKYEIDKANFIKQSKDLCTKLSIHDRDRCFTTQDSFLFLFVDEILDNNMVLCRIIHLRKFDSLFKRPCDSKILTFANSVEQVL